MAVLRGTVHNRLRHGELPLTAFLRRSRGFDTVTPTPTLPLTLRLPPPLFHSASFHFQSHPHLLLRPTPHPPRTSHSVAAPKAFLNRRHCGPPFSFSVYFFSVLTLKSVPASLPPCSPCTVILNFTQFSVPRGGRKENKKTERNRDESERRALRRITQEVARHNGWCPHGLNNAG